jgi:translation initiation factor 2B subunit (eIF-2B alpha/beta/delta family)
MPKLIYLMKREEKRLELVEKTIQDIKDVKIQGANNIAINGIKAATLTDDKKILYRIANARPTEPLLQNSIEIISNSKHPLNKANKLTKYIEDSRGKIAYIGSKLIKNDMNVFSHCHSSTVMDILKYAKKFRKVNFTVYTLEVEPLLQGRKTAEELSKYGINVIVFPDLAAEAALKKCEVFLFGADAYVKKGIVNKIGTELLCKVAQDYCLPAYSCGVSLKYTKKVKIESRSGREVWDERNKRITIVNPAFDFTNRKYVTGVISELGILDYKSFVKKAKKTKDNLSK